MKEYKGWELIKMANEGKIKDGDEFSSNCLYVKFRRTNINGSFRNECGKEVGNSYFTKEQIYTKVRKKLTFFEAIAKADEGEKVTNSYVLDGIEKDDLPKGYWHKDSKGILVWHDIEDCDDKYDVYLIDKELQSNWYVYEE